MRHALTGVFFLATFSSTVLNAQEPLGKAQTVFTPQERENAKAIDADLAKQCQANGDQCRRAYGMLLFQAQLRLAEWGYGTKITGEPDATTVAAIRLYQQRNGLPETGKLDGLTTVRMDADEKAVEAYPFTLPSLYFPEKWPSALFRVNGVFRDTTTGQTSGPIEIECDAEWHLCLEEESTTVTPGVSKMTIKEWTADHIVAEEVALCYTNQLRIERASKTVVHTSIKTRNDGPCASFLGNSLASIYSEELVDGVKAQLQRSEARAAAVRRVKLLSGWAKSQMESDQSTEKKK
jgi:peptidoglycan hydrolase-like protein with peptidoglycan-binding domain